MLHFVKYNLIGIMNTLITLVVSWVLFEILDCSLVLSNFLGFIAGGINSYVMNRIWNFKSNNEKKTEMIRFLVVFLCAYGLNLLVLKGCEYALINFSIFDGICQFTARFTKPTFLANIVANVVYVLASYTLYKKWVFRK
ncbi:GtrA family protein [Fibrobacter sp. UWEL]|uniref:GtrA family protein n=1 Tax=Fibrobacter sp. UWEL TaxID=1896209 RepID=UPI00091810B5|nr:GtrA family protein [Fibrobacter sp. UWEL]SHL00248.1 Putative flippase GtrA (transmembrane translocase of bactoprenol-linked glucose) [Fibrobacter sp. UWEL]